MKGAYTPYRDRSIAFVETLVVESLTAKVYTISDQDKFSALATLQAVRMQLKNWSTLLKTTPLSTHQNAFIIVHQANEGIIILFNWWTGENMIETKLFFAKHDTPSNIEASLFKSKQLVCIWELEVFYHERKAWIRHVLSKPTQPDYLAYQNDIYQKKYERIS